ncbi:ribonucleases P/MRP protein subunit POP1-domain-containing protein [Bisporella sp. PMI_857]|nr:ribonucleases P/MRP protein subunit POP1-domain-containing protein [Bisporella sp. PMI_857]
MCKRWLCVYQGKHQYTKCQASPRKSALSFGGQLIPLNSELVNAKKRCVEVQTFIMPPKSTEDASKSVLGEKKRKLVGHGTEGPNKRVKVQIARTVLTQSADAALKNGELDLQSFLNSREFEIKALENSMVKSKSALNLRAFQQVPRNLRRRTASHNVKRVPKRIQNRHRREMIQDNAPTVNASKRKPGSSKGRVRAETAKRLGLLSVKKKRSKVKDGKSTDSASIHTRQPRPKIRTGKLNDPQKPKSKFRKRQIHKTWLPTHLWHAKRAKMTEPKNPWWRFAIPVTSTEKSYRPTHRAGGARGAVAWDMSYMSTIGLEGQKGNLECVLKALGVAEQRLWELSGEKWRAGKRVWNGWLSKEDNKQIHQIGPSTVIYCPPGEDEPSEDTDMDRLRKPNTRLLLRIHPSTFLETWNEVLRLSKLQRPNVNVTDLRFEIGSIEITGPGSTEALLGILNPYPDSKGSLEEHSQVFESLRGVTNPSSMPSNAVLSFSVKDPRLQYPPRTIPVFNSSDEDANLALLRTLATWPADMFKGSSALFNREARLEATRLPSQKAINRRKALAKPGSYPSLKPVDPKIPIIIFTTRAPAGASAQGSWTLMAPWKCILPIWYGLMHYPLSSGGNPRFGGIQELRQIHFERGVPWFPADYPATVAGFTWETAERERRKAEWERRPRGKRIEWDSIDLGAKRKGEIGRGWACDFETLIGIPSVAVDKSAEDNQEMLDFATYQAQSIESPFQQVPLKLFANLLSSKDAELPALFNIATIRIALVSRGVASPCARIYRLPSSSSSQVSDSSSPTLSTSSREEWLALLPAKTGKKPLPNPKSKASKHIGRIPLNTPLPERVRLLAQSLIQPPSMKGTEDDYPLIPDREDLIGFVTTGEFNLAEGKGVAIGSVVVAKAVEAARRDGATGNKNGRLCIVRNSGEKIGRLASWEPV